MESEGGARVGRSNVFRSIAAASSLAVGCAGCSWVDVRGAPHPAPPWPEPVRCTFDSDAPSLDSTGAVLFGVPAVVALVVGLSTKCPQGSEFINGCAIGAGNAVLLGVGSGLIAAMYWLAAWSGYSTMSRCREEIEERTVANLIIPRLRAPWDSTISRESLSLMEARRFCDARHLRLPARGDALALSAELGAGAQIPLHLVIWTRELQGPAALANVRAFSMDLATGGVTSHDLDEEFHALCSAQ